MIELFKHIVELDFDWLFANYGTAIYILLFMIIFIETGVVAMPFLPGDSLLFTAGLFCKSGHLDIFLLLPLLFSAAVIGDNSNYWIGRKIGLTVFTYKVRGRQLVKKDYLEKTELFFIKNGTKAIILARFIPLVRTFAPFAAGVGKMNYKTFFTYDVVGGFIWVFSLTVAGYLLGEINWIRENIDLVCLGIILLSVLPLITKLVSNQFRKK
ncbi:MAG: VTT domain-containing protein [Bacteroidetes bacterium]|nr:VTT domain-containing protein [Bacteroidota bacterium]